jgi:hypothetical protein
VATAPAWGFDLRDVTRTVLTTGLPTQRPPAEGPLTPEAWTQLRAESSRHHLVGLLVAAVAGGTLVATDEQRAEMAALEVELTMARMWHEQRMVEVVASLEAAGIAVRVLKGLALAALDYPDLQWRPTSDLDLLVRGDQIDAADALLTVNGGVRTDLDPVPGFTAIAGKGATLAMPDGLEVDLHRLLVYGPLGVRVPPDELWRAGRSFEAGGGQRFETLGLEETLLHACLHVLVLGWRRALGLRDIAQLLTNPAFDADRAIPLSRRWGAEAVLATGVLLAHRELDLGDDLPVLDWARGLPVRWRDQLWLRIERPDDPVPGVEAVATYAELRTAAERRMFWAATLHPTPGTWSSPGERIERLARRAGRVLTSRFG